jgi:hypothetical protein
LVVDETKKGIWGLGGTGWLVQGNAGTQAFPHQRLTNSNTSARTMNQRTLWIWLEAMLPTPREYKCVVILDDAVLSRTAHGINMDGLGCHWTYLFFLQWGHYNGRSKPPTLQHPRPWSIFGQLLRRQQVSPAQAPHTSLPQPWSIFRQLLSKQVHHPQGESDDEDDGFHVCWTYHWPPQSPTRKRRCKK